MAVMGVSTIAPAFPKIMSELGISKASVGLLITVFTLPGVILAPLIGVIADRFGRRRILVPALLLFGVAGAACSVAPTFGLLLVFRTLQGVGAGGLGALATTLIGDLYSGRRRIEAMGVNASVLSIGTASYPAIGGGLAELSWRYPFVLSLAAIPIGLLVVTVLRNPEPRNKQALRAYLGGALSHLKRLKVLGLFVAGVLTFTLLYGAQYTYLSLFLDESFGASPATIGIILTSASVATAVVSAQAGRLNRRFSEATLIKAAFVTFGIAFALIPFMPGLWTMLVPAGIFGVGMGISIPSLMNMVAGLAPLDYRGAVMSLNASMFRVGQTAGPPVIGVAYVLGGFEGAFLGAAGLALAAALLGVVVGWVVGRRTVAA